VESNFGCRFGEIDIVMDDDGVLVFVEVRYRSRPDFGGALESIDKRKQYRLRRTAELYLQHHPEYSAWPCRFDVVSITGRGAKDFEFNWIKNAF